MNTLKKKKKTVCVGKGGVCRGTIFFFILAEKHRLYLGHK